MKKALFLVLIVILVTASSGCVHRKLTIISDPPGATAYFNHREVGTTPVEFDFMWYHDKHVIMLKKEGYKTFKTTEAIMSPKKLFIPLDLIAQLRPKRVEDYREFSYTLTPLPEEGTPLPSE